jgi:selT/selW/selH-like putative selenoprotein
LIQKEFPGVQVEDRMDPVRTGNFEVFVNGTLVHSKTHQGHGFLHENAAQQQVVLKAIRDASL